MYLVVLLSTLTVISRLSVSNSQKVSIVPGVYKWEEEYANNAKLIKGENGINTMLINDDAVPDIIAKVGLPLPENIEQLDGNDLLCYQMINDIDDVPVEAHILPMPFTWNEDYADGQNVVFDFLEQSDDGMYTYLLNNGPFPDAESLMGPITYVLGSSTASLEYVATPTNGLSPVTRTGQCTLTGTEIHDQAICTNAFKEGPAETSTETLTPLFAYLSETSTIALAPPTPTNDDQLDEELEIASLRMKHNVFDYIPDFQVYEIKAFEDYYGPRTMLPMPFAWDLDWEDMVQAVVEHEDTTEDGLSTYYLDPQRVLYPDADQASRVTYILGPTTASLRYVATWSNGPRLESEARTGQCTFSNTNSGDIAICTSSFEAGRRYPETRTETMTPIMVISRQQLSKDAILNPIAIATVTEASTTITATSSTTPSPALITPGPTATIASSR